MILRLSGEHEFPVPPLALPGPDQAPDPAPLACVSAVAMFLERAEASCPQFVLTPANAAAVAAICRQLDGLPLALELAAAWIQLLPPEALLTRLADHRLGVLVDGARDLPERQRTLRATLQWSYDLLSRGEQALFRRLSIFAGSIPLEAIEPVCQAAGPLEPDVLQALAGLVDKSLVRRREDEPATVGPRLYLLATVREYGLELLRASGEAEATAAAYAAHALSRALAAADG